MGQAAEGPRLGGRALDARRTGPWAQARGACAAGEGSVRGIGRQGAKRAPGRAWCAGWANWGLVHST